MRFTALLAALAFAPLLACADDSSSASTTPTTSPTGSSTTTPEAPAAKPQLSEADRALAKQQLSATWLGTFVGTRTMPGTSGGTVEVPVELVVEIDKDLPVVRCGNVNSDLRCIDVATAVLPLRATVSYPNQDRGSEVIFGRAALRFALIGGGTSNADGAPSFRDGGYTSGTVISEEAEFTIDGVEWPATSTPSATGVETVVKNPDNGTFKFVLGRSTK
jgi:hypothetical protein